MKNTYYQLRPERHHRQTGAMTAGATTFVILILLAAGAAGFYYYTTLADDAEAADKATKAQGKDGIPPIYLDLEPAFIVNFEHKGTLRYLQANLSIMARNQAVIDKVTLHMPAIRDRILTLLSNKTYAELSGKARKEKLRLEVLLEIRKIVGASDTGHSVENNLSPSWRKALVKLAMMLRTPDRNILETGGTVAIVGATGVGKTTTVAKLAGKFALQHGRDAVGLVTTDCFRIGGHEQLMTFARLLGIPVSLATNQEELSNALDRLSNRKLILIDTAGMSQRDMGLPEQFSTLNGAGHDIQICLALSAVAQKEITEEVIDVFNTLGPAGSIITKVDETVSLGGMLSAHIQHHLPVMFFSEGQRIPEDLNVAKPVELVKVAHYLMEKTGWQQSELQQQKTSPINAYSH